MVLAAAALVALPVGEDGQHLFGAGHEGVVGHNLLIVLLHLLDEVGSLDAVLRPRLGEGIPGQRRVAAAARSSG